MSISHTPPIPYRCSLLLLPSEVFRHSQVSARLELVLKRSQENGSRLSGCLAVGGDKPATCHGDKVVFTLQGNQWGRAASKYPAAASWLIFISAVIFASRRCQLQLNVAPAMIPSCGCLEWKKGQLSAVNICVTFCQLFIVIHALYQYNWL